MVASILAGLLIVSYFLALVVGVFTVAESFNHSFKKQYSHPDRIIVGDKTTIINARALDYGDFPIAFDKERNHIMGHYGEKVTLTYLKDLDNMAQ